MQHASQRLRSAFMVGIVLGTLAACASDRAGSGKSSRRAAPPVETLDGSNAFDLPLESSDGRPSPDASVQPAAATMDVARDEPDREPELEPAPDSADASVSSVDSGVATETLEDPSGPSFDFEWKLPAGFPAPRVPPGNPMSRAKVELGRRLFYDPRLSRNQTQSCASCHLQSLAFTDGRATSVGSTGQPHPRSAMSLVNVAYAASLTWSNPLFAIGVVPEPLERQTLLPLYGDRPVELGLRSQSEIEERLQNDADYPRWFADAFPQQSEPVTAQNIGRALAAFERTLISAASPFDHFQQGEPDAMSEAAQRGYWLFQSERLGCTGCHGGFNFSDHVQYEGKELTELIYHNTGLYNLDEEGRYPSPNTGVFDVTQNAAEMGAFKAPSLRNIAVTAPYMHDGSVATLAEVLEHYAAGGRTLADGENAGVGSENPWKDPRVHGFALSESERAELLEFFDALTDEELLHSPAFSDPWR